MDIKSGLERLSKLTYQKIGTSEENVKQKIAVPLLELLGHNINDLDFEYGSQGKRIDIFIKGLPQDCKVVIDTKNTTKIYQIILNKSVFTLFRKVQFLH